MEDCPGADTIGFLAKKHMLKIIATMFFYNKSLRFTELKSELDINTATLTSRLRELESQGFIKRIVYNEIPFRVEYVITELGERLKSIFYAIQEFDDHHDFVQESSAISVGSEVSTL